ncbi:hypothetical protein MsAg5_04170 [Methanosarcinaceae archaeon Ag5]|uniref:Transglutaminase-like domain-containing protein n=1 Tax=Methanolapillus africanus TaxID=3028297 RepID=A0AAE4SCJ6_9EURY|nr:hypothetical protein [Methanosarcinaceae archaeon Ag5]
MGKMSKMIFLVLFVVVLAALVFYVLPLVSDTNPADRLSNFSNPANGSNQSNGTNSSGNVSAAEINDPDRVNYFNNQVDEPGYYTRTYNWTYDNQSWSYTVSVPIDMYNDYRNKSHTRGDYSQYAVSPDDRAVLGQIVDSFKQQGALYNYSEDQVVENMIAFIQAMPYTSDSVTTGFDEYPRYPIETLVDGGGDCEDSSILAAALLNEMGYDTALLGFDNHMALGVAGIDNAAGTYFERNGKYYYVETTSNDYDIGEVPPGVDKSTIHIYKMNITAALEGSVSRKLIAKGESAATHEITVVIRNRGPNTAENVTVEMNGIFSKSSRMNDTQNIDSIGVNQTKTVTATFTFPRGQFAEFRGTIYGDNFETVDIILSPFSQE